MLRFIVLVTLNYAWAAVCPPYVVTYGLSHGYSQSQVSIGVSLEMFCLILGNVLWGRISDHFRTNKKIWMLCMTIAAADVFFLFTSRSYGGFLAGFCLLGTVNGATGILMDTWVLKQLGNDIAKYGRIRSFGAAGYAAAMLAAGFIIKTRGYFALAAVSLMIWAAAVGIALFLAEKPWETAEGTAGTPLKRKAGEREISGRRELFRDFLNRDYLLWLLLLFLAGMAIAPCNNLKIVILGKAGGDVSSQGLDGFLGCAVQFFLFFLVGKLGNLAPRRRMLIVTASISAGIVCYLTAASTLQVYLGTILIHGVYSIVNPATREIVTKTVPGRSHTTAIGIGDTCYSHFSNMLIMTVSGTVSERFGLNVMLSVCLCIALAAVALCAMTAGEGDARGNSI